MARPAMNLATKFEKNSQIEHWCDWKVVAADADRWMMEGDEFMKFCMQWPGSFHRLLLFS